MFIKGREPVGIENWKIPKAFLDYSQTNHDVYENLEDYNPSKKRKVLIAFDDMMADMESNKKLSPTVTELFLRGLKLNILLVIISQSYSKGPKIIGLNGTHYFIMKISNKREIQQIASNHSFDIDFKYFMKPYKYYTKEQYSFLVKDTTLSSDNLLEFRKNLL